MKPMKPLNPIVTPNAMHFKQAKNKKIRMHND